MNRGVLAIALSLVCAAAGSSSKAAPSRTALPPEVTVLRSDDDGIRLLLRTPAPDIFEAEPGGDADISIDGWSASGAPGEPELPRCSFLVGLPDGARAEIKVLRVVTYPLAGVNPRPIARTEIHDPARSASGGLDPRPGQDDRPPEQTLVRIRDASAYARLSPGSWADLREIGRLRHLSIVPVDLSPVRWDPSIRGLLVARELEVEVRFVRNQSLRREETIPPTDGAYRWDEVYRRAVVNPDEAARYLTSPVATQRRLSGGRAPEFRILVDRTAIHRIRFEDLATAGWSTQPLPAERVALSERFYDDTADDPFIERAVPIFLRDLDRDGAFGAGDDILFFGQTTWDRLHPPPHQKKYGRQNAYFLSARPEGGARMAEAGSFLGRNDLTPTATTQWTERFEGDGAYMSSVAAGDQASQQELGVEALRHDPFLWVGGTQALSGIPMIHTRSFELPGFDEIVGARFAMQEIFGQFNAAPTISIGPEFDALVPLPTDFRVSAKARKIVTAPVEHFAGIPLAETPNQFRIQAAEGAHGAAIDWIEWTYRRSFAAFRDVTAWRTANDGDVAGPREYRPSGFTQSDSEGSDQLVVFDLSDSLAPRRLTYSEQQLGDEGRSLRLQFDLASPEAPAVLTVLRPSAAAAPTSIAREAEIDLTAGGADDLIVVTADEFSTEVERLAARRREQGLAVSVAPIRAIYDQFAGGRAWPTGIRGYLRHLFRTRDVDPSFLLLFGDGSNDFAGVLRGQNDPNHVSGPNLVPTQTLFSFAYSSSQHELVASDEWFVDDLSGTGERLDFYPDMHVGRLSPGTAAEAAVIVQKVLDYDEVLPGEAWRNRALLISDDEYSTRIANTESYVWHGDPNRADPKGDESVFVYAARQTRRIIHEEAGFSDFGVDTFFVADYMDTVACLGRCIPIDASSPDCGDWRCPFVGGDLPNEARVRSATCYGFSGCPAACERTCDNLTYGETVVSGDLLPVMSRGHVFVSYQGHAHNQLLSHEFIYKDSNFSGLDSQRLQNVGKPFIFMGFGCHLAEFSIYFESRRGESSAERMMFLPDGRGAIAAIGSTGYEWLPNNADFNLALMRAWWLDPPTAPDGGTRWLLGEMFTAGKYELMARHNANATAKGMIGTYALLGDPTMGVDLGPPRMDAILVNGEEWVNGQALVAAGESDSVTIEVRLRDEVQISTATVFDRDGQVPAERVRFLPDPEYPGDDRRRILRYTARLIPTSVDYEIELRATDRSGRTSSARFPVRVETSLAVKLENAYRPVSPNDFLQGGDSLRVVLQLPTRLPAEAFSVVVDGVLLSGVQSVPTDLHPDGSTGWTLQTRIPGVLEAGEHTLSVSIETAEEPVVRSFTFQGAATDVELLELYNFPNPCSGPTRFYYTLNGSAERAELSVFTLRGRKILETNGPALRGENMIEWDGRDRDGDELANGVYFYELRVRTVDGRELKKLERLARAR